MTDPADALRTILTDVQDILQKRLAEIGATETPHVLMAIGPNGMAIVRANVAPKVLKAMAMDLGDAADQAMRRQPDDEAIH